MTRQVYCQITSCSASSPSEKSLPRSSSPVQALVKTSLQGRPRFELHHLIHWSATSRKKYSLTIRILPLNIARVNRA